MEQLIVLIETLRQRLNQHAYAKTILSSNEVLALSKQLDVLIVKYQHEMIQQHKKRKKSA